VPDPDWQDPILPVSERDVSGGRIAFGCVTESSDRFLQQSARLLLSLRWFGGPVHDAAFFLCVVGDLPAPARRFFEKYGARIVPVERFSPAHGPSNKLRFLELDELDAWTHAVLLDCDTLIVQDPSAWVQPAGLGAKVADMPTVTADGMRRIGARLGIDFPLDTMQHDVAQTACGPYFNSGVVAVAREWRALLARAWAQRNRQVLVMLDAASGEFRFTDQISLALAACELEVAVTPLPSVLNLPCHLHPSVYPDHFHELDPVIVHYHWLSDDRGYVLKSPLRRANLRLAAFNARLRAERKGAPAPPAGRRRSDAGVDGAKVIVGSGWWCDGKPTDYQIGDPRTRSPWFFEVWMTQILRCLAPERVVITDSDSPVKPDYQGHDRVVWVPLDANYGHANDIRLGRITTKYSGFTRSVLNGAMYAMCCDADYFVYVEQDCLIVGEDFLRHAVGDSECDILIGQRTTGGRGLSGRPAAPMLQQSLMIVKRSGLARFLIGLLRADWTDGEVSPEETMGRIYDPLDVVRVPFGRSRPLDYALSHYYVQHLQADELEQLLGSLAPDGTVHDEGVAPFYESL
jgi:hypothetical protein